MSHFANEFADFDKAHAHSDLDSQPQAQHHTLGGGPNQASRGNHNHNGVYSPIDHVHATEGTNIGMVIMWMGANGPSSEYLLLNGQLIYRADYPDLFTVMNVPAGQASTYLPDWRDRFPVGAGPNHPLNGTKNATVLTLDKTSQGVTKGNDFTAIDTVSVHAPGTSEPDSIAINFFVKAR